MSRRDEYAATMEAQLAEWSVRLQGMKVQLEEAELAGRREFHRQIEASQQQHEAARQQLDALQKSTEGAWKTFQAAFEAARKELADSLAQHSR